MLIQGDSLPIIRADVSEIAEACDQGDVGEAREAAAALLSHLDELLARYTGARKARDIHIPFHPGSLIAQLHHVESRRV